MRLFFILLIAIGAINTTHAQLTNGLIAHWDFNGNTNDMSGNNLHGTPNNITYTAGKAGGANTAANFNGTNSVIDVAYNNLMNSNTMSICAVVRFEDFYSGYCQVSMILHRGETFQPGSYSLCIYDNHFDNSCSTYSPNNFLFHHKTADIENYVAPQALAYTPYVQKKQWYTIVATYDGFTTNMYVDGVLKTTYTSNLPKGTTTYNMAIGGSTTYNRTLHPFWLNGQIDDLRVYNRALTITEIEEYDKLSDTTIALKDTITKLACIGDTFHLAYTTSVRFLPGNTFNAQLSDINGSFSNPILLGSLVSDTSGMIICTVPPGLLPGKGSMIRVVSTTSTNAISIADSITLFDNKPAVLQITASPSGFTLPGQSITYTAHMSNAGDAPKIEWYRNGVLIGNVSGNTFTINTLNHGDSVYAEVTSNSPCTLNAVTRSNAIYVWSNTDVGTLLLQNLRVFPNPGTGSFTLTANDISYKELAVTVYNATGQMVYSSIINPQQKLVNEHITLSDVANGIFLLRISADGKDRNIRLLISK